MKKRKWTVERIQEVALDCKTRNEFRKKHPSAYNAAHNYEIMEEVCSHMQKPYECNVKWSDDYLIKTAEPYKELKDFIKDHQSLYETARTRKILKKVTGHMKKTKVVKEVAL